MFWKNKLMLWLLWKYVAKKYVNYFTVTLIDPTLIHYSRFDPKALSIVMKLPTAVSEIKRLRQPTDRWLTWRLCTVARSTGALSHWYPPDGHTIGHSFFTTGKPTRCGIRTRRGWREFRVFISKDGCLRFPQMIHPGANGRRSTRNRRSWIKYWYHMVLFSPLLPQKNVDAVVLLNKWWSSWNWADPAPLTSICPICYRSPKTHSSFRHRYHKRRCNTETRCRRGSAVKIGQQHRGIPEAREECRWVGCFALDTQVRNP